MPGHYWIIGIIILAAVLLLIGPRLLPALGRRLGRRARETGAASKEAASAFKSELGGDDPPSEDKPG
jgi:Sec-independent protein translocase protein TatA